MKVITTEAATLLVLEEGKQFGGGIIERAGELGVTLSQGSLYPTLKRLIANGHIKVAQQVQRQGRPQVWYKLTAKGRKEAEHVRQLMYDLLEG